MSILPTYDFNAPDGSTHLALSAGEVHRQFVPHRSLQWVQRGLKEGARSVFELVNAAEARRRKGLVASRKGTLNSNFNGTKRT